MQLILKLRDAFLRPRKILNKIEGVKNGISILDYGCGPGSFTLAAPEIVCIDGTVFAADIHPLALEHVRKSASKRGFKNIKTILTADKTDLPDSSIDIILLFYVLHDFHNPSKIIIIFIPIDVHVVLALRNERTTIHQNITVFQSSDSPH